METLKENTDVVLKPVQCFGVRHVQMVILFLGMVIAFSMRADMSMAIVAMTDSSNENSFDWSVKIQSVILSSFFWGYVVLQIPGGGLAARFGGKLLISCVIGINAVICLLIPIAASLGGWQLICGCRVLQGLSQGFVFPTMHTLISQWAPPEEKARLSSFIYAGPQLGSALQFMISGFIADFWGWPSIFYVNGSIGAIWTAVYVFIGADSPQNSTFISEEERWYIQNSLGQVGGHKKFPTPWKKIWTSLPFISLIVVNCGHNWCFWILMTEIPSYMSSVLRVNIKTNGIMSALPYLAMYLITFPLGYLSDLILRKNWLSVTAARKLSNTLGLWGPAVLLVGLSHVPVSSIATAVAFLTVTVAMNAAHITGFLLVHIDMAPNFAGTMMGITNGIGSIISILAPLAAGQLLEDETDIGDWRKVFYLSSFICFLTNFVYIVFGTSEKQEWNEPKGSIADCVTETVVVGNAFPEKAVQ